MSSLILTDLGKQVAQEEITEAMKNLREAQEALRSLSNGSNEYIHVTRALELLERVRIAMAVDWSPPVYDETIILLNEPDDLPF